MPSVPVTSSIDLSALATMRKRATRFVSGNEKRHTSYLPWTDAIRYPPSFPSGASVKPSMSATRSLPSTLAMSLAGRLNPAPLRASRYRATRRPRKERPSDHRQHSLPQWNEGKFADEFSLYALTCGCEYVGRNSPSLPDDDRETELLFSRCDTCRSHRDLKDQFYERLILVRDLNTSLDRAERGLSRVAFGCSPRPERVPRRLSRSQTKIDIVDPPDGEKVELPGRSLSYTKSPLFLSVPKITLFVGSAGLSQNLRIVCCILVRFARARFQRVAEHRNRRTSAAKAPAAPIPVAIIAIVTSLKCLRLHFFRSRR